MKSVKNLAISAALLLWFSIAQAALDEKEQALENYEQAVELVPREGEQPNLMKKLEGLRRELE